MKKIILVSSALLFPSLVNATCITDNMIGKIKNDIQEIKRHKKVYETEASDIYTDYSYDLDNDGFKECIIDYSIDYGGSSGGQLNLAFFKGKDGKHISTINIGEISNKRGKLLAGPSGKPYFSVEHTAFIYPFYEYSEKDSMCCPSIKSNIGFVYDGTSIEILQY